MFEKLELYIKNNLESNTYIKFNKFKYGRENASCTVFMDEDKDLDIIDLSYLNQEFDKNKIDKFIKKTKDENKFQNLLLKLIDERNLKDSEVYNKVHIDRRLFSKIRSDRNYHPSKETVLLLCLALELNEKQALDLLNSAAYSLPKNNVSDLIMRFCFIEHIYDLTQINEFLEQYNCKLIGF